MSKRSRSDRRWKLATKSNVKVYFFFVDWKSGVRDNDNRIRFWGKKLVNR